MGDHYNEGYHGRIHRNLIDDDEYFWSRSATSAELYLTDSERAGSVFEYGCGIGQGIASLPNGAGWDISKEALAECRGRGVTVYEDMSDVPRRQWSVVICRHVLEHVEDPLETLRTLASLLADGGKLIVILPRERHYAATLVPDDHQHLYAWNFRTINNLFWRAGLRPTRNYSEYVLGYRTNLPVRRRLGAAAYLLSLKVAGRLMNNGELIVWGHRQSD